MKPLFASILLVAACGSDPLDPGAGDNGGTGTSTLLVEGRANAEPHLANAAAETDFDTEFSVRISLNDVPVTTGTVTVSSRFGEFPLTWHADPGRWEGRAANYDEVYELNVISGDDDVRGVVVDGPDIHLFKSPMQGATLDSTIQNPLTWDRDETADLASFDAEEIDRLQVPDTGSYMMGIGVLRAERDQVRENQLSITRTNYIVPKGAVAGSQFAVTVENYIDVLIAPNPNLP